MEEKQTEELKSQTKRFRDFYSSLPFLSLCDGTFIQTKGPLLSLPSHPQGGQRSGSVTTLEKVKGLVVILPALAVCETKVHAVAGEEGEGAQREFHTGWVGDGFTQQGHHSASRGQPGAAIELTDVPCTVKNLWKWRGKNESKMVELGRVLFQVKFNIPISINLLRTNIVISQTNQIAAKYHLYTNNCTRT